MNSPFLFCHRLVIVKLRKQNIRCKKKAKSMMINFRAPKNTKLRYIQFLFTTFMTLIAYRIKRRYKNSGKYLTIFLDCMSKCFMVLRKIRRKIAPKLKINTASKVASM